MPDIKVTVRNKIAVGDGTEIVCGNSDYTVVFDFDAEWEAFDAKTMRVRFTNDTYKDVVFNGTSCILPIVQNSVGVDIGVFAGALHTTSVATFDCVKSILSGGGSPDTSEPIIDSSIIELINNKPGEKCEGKIFNIPTGETDADGNAIYEEKTAGIGTERFNVYEDASFEWNGVTRTFTPCKPIGKFISARGTGNISRGLLEDVCGADNKTGEKDIGTRQSGCANYAESYFGSQDGCGGTLTGKYGRTSGAYNVARGYACEARGRYTIADGSHGNVSGKPQETFGQFNVPDDTQKYMAIGGNGTDNEHRSNAYMLDYDGNAYYSGNVKIGGTPSDDNDAATKAYVDAHSGSSKQGDWNQNDTTAADYIKNRPGAYMGDETIYDGTPTTALASTGSYSVMLSPDFMLTAGNAYRVTFNGTAYVLTAQDKTAEVSAIILGELTSDNSALNFANYPFLIATTPLMGQRADLFTETAGTYTLKVESLGTVVVPLDSRFMPLGYATEAFVTNAIAGYATEEFVTNAINAALYVDSQTEVG